METKKQIKELTKAALVAKEVRTILKEKFKGIKFTVRSSNYSMGDSVNVGWTDGPTSEEVEKLVKHYQYGHFDGMIDCYEYSNVKKDIPQTKFLFCNRDMSEETKKIICEIEEIKNPEEWNEKWNCWNSSVICQQFNKMEIKEMAI